MEKACYQTEMAGKLDACKGCPNAKTCSTKAVIEQYKGPVLAVMSGKGGVGKSTFSRNIAECLAHSGLKTALLDYDFTGPSIPKLTGCEDIISTVRISNNLFFIRESVPQENYDIVVIDTPPGIGDEHLEMIRRFANVWTVIVTTPQKMSFSDVVRQIKFCYKANISLVGIVENMKGYVCPCCKHLNKIFNECGVLAYCEEKGIQYLGYIGIINGLARKCDEGEFVEEPIFKVIANEIRKKLQI
ncbi:Cytosolic Fe-S cluster assembly factor nubp1 [Astathelohania contejeani]|uniref:Cytosolic Fe-S cluster assembly factor nubp1 n=1 Tax=Astathelohania contejeani TaxID=164912 RepID=A0ABQ7I2I2_9MICR|nr:Cytosolic Fe-S cluster assembly factor nubp1 [Thelohania contejeani]